jgi:hypothetical protein
MDEFHYTALGTRDSFRIMSIEHGGDVDGSPLIRIQLKEHAINGSPAYKALSYTWTIDKSRRKRVMKAFPKLVTHLLKSSTVREDSEKKSTRWFNKMNPTNGKEYEVADSGDRDPMEATASLSSSAGKTLISDKRKPSRE